MSSQTIRENLEGHDLIRDSIRIVPDFPKPGISFYDIATLLDNPEAWRETIEQFKARIAPLKVDKLIGIESRGFLVAAPLAYELGCAFGMARKKGKLPGETLGQKYALEYGEDEIEIQPDLITPGARVAIIDDLLATGGTLHATEQLLTKAGAEVVGSFCIIELDGLNGREKLSAPFEALLNCPA